MFKHVIKFFGAYFTALIKLVLIEQVHKLVVMRLGLSGLLLGAANVVFSILAVTWVLFPIVKKFRAKRRGKGYVNH